VSVDYIWREDWCDRWFSCGFNWNMPKWKASLSKWMRTIRSSVLCGERNRREAQDAAILETQSEQLNGEALDVLEYQRLPLGERTRRN